MSVFDDIERDLTGGKPYLISQFEYLNRSSRVEAAKVRSVVDDLLSRYPRAAQEAIRHRLRSVDDVGHLGAFFELATHELLVRAGCRILQVEPPIAGTNRSPDFLVEDPAGGRFYLEATIATGRSRDDAAAQQRLDEAYRAIDSVDSPDFMLSVETTGMPTDPVSGRRLKAEIHRWLAGLPYEDVASACERQEDLPVFAFEEHGVAFTISPVPRRETRGERGGRVIAAFTLPPLQVQPQAAIANAVAGKAGRYGTLDLPYVVAVNAMAEFARDESAVDALFGTPGFVTRVTENGYEEREVRNFDGAWHGRGGPINTRISAVISTERLTPWSLGQRRARIVRNPWAARPLPNTDFGIDSHDMRDDWLHVLRARSFHEIFELPEGWPE
jgi:hypothetical protein